MNSKKKDLAKNTIILMLGKVCTQFISFILLPLYTTFLNTNEYGTVDLIITYVSLFVPVITFQLESAIFRYLIDVRKNEKEKSRIISSAYVFVFITTLIISLIYIFLSIFINYNLNYYIIILIIATILSSLTLQTSRGLGDNIGYTIGSVLAGGFTIIFNVIFLVVFKLGVASILISQALANIICFIFLVKRVNLFTYIKLKNILKEYVKKLLKYSLPLIPNGIIWWIINVSDRTIVSLFLGTSANGIYAVANKFSNIFMHVYNIFNMSWTESIALHLNEEDGEKFLSEMMDEILNLFSSLCFMLLGIMPFIFPLMVDKSYISAYDYIPVLMLGAFCTIFVTMMGAIYIAKKMTKEIAKTSLYAGIVNIVVNLLLIKKIGIYAAAISTVVAFIIMAVYRYFDVQKYVKLSINGISILRMIVVYAIICTFYYLNNTILNMMILIFTLIYSICINKNTLINIKNTLLSKIRFVKL